MPSNAATGERDKAQITVIIPTVGDERRAETIWRAIKSAGAASGASTCVLVVVNGTRFSPRLLAQLQATPEIDCLTVDQGSLPLALLRGREAAQSEFFAFLDDDDEFLVGGLGRRLEALRNKPSAAFLISQGWFHADGRDVPQTNLDSKSICEDPMGSLLRENWVATSASGLYRSSVIGAPDFEAMPSYLEWTYLGFRLASRHPFIYMDEPTYRRYDVVGSVSKSRAFQRGMIPAMRAILALDLPAVTKRGLRAKLARAAHDLSVLALEGGELADAWRRHWQSLALPGGLRFLPYTRHLIVPTLLASVRRS